MKFNELWLREFIKLDINIKNLSESITMLGLKVNSIEPVSGYFKKIIIGKIIDCYKHPNSNSLFITKIDIGSKNILQIICSSHNCRNNIKVVVALIGASILKKYIVKNLILFGKNSEGMLCSFSELGIYGYDKGIIELPDDAPIGTNIKDYLKLKDNILDISITPNRSDCFSILGITRDISVYKNINHIYPIIKNVIPSINDIIPITIDSSAYNFCSHYLGRIIKNININTFTPLWMKEKLRRCGFKSNNVIIDITNYVLLELGQPVHIYNYDNIKNGIIIRLAKNGEKIKLFNKNKNIKLKSKTLIITDYKKIISIAGILVGIEFSVNIKTKNIFLESAFFEPSIINNYSKFYNFNTNSSHRYERGVDPNIQKYAIERTTELLISICGGKAGPILNINSKKNFPKSNKIIIRRKKINQIIGYYISNKIIENILIRLGCLIYKIKSGWKIFTPSWRFDLSIEEDLIEEIIRIYGYNLIPNTPIYTNLLVTNHYNKSISLSRIKTLLINYGYQEIITYSFVDPKKQTLIHPKKIPLILPKPISQDMSVMRLSLWTGLLKTLVYNQNRQHKFIRLFETGLCFIPDNKSYLKIKQNLMLGGLISGPRFNEHWDQKNKLVDFYDIKGNIESIFDLIGKLNYVEFISKKHPALHPGQSAEIFLKNQSIGWVGMIHPKIEEKFNLKNKTLVFELTWSKISDSIFSVEKNISKFPLNRRDISIIVSESIMASDIILECKKIKEKRLISINLFDVYKGKGIASGYKSFALRFILQDIKRTLTEEEISKIIKKYINSLNKKFNASLRGIN